MANTPPTIFVPDRNALLSQLHRANQWAGPLIGGQLLIAIWLATKIDWQEVLHDPLVTLVAMGMMAGPTLMGTLAHWVQKKKRIEDLKETTRFGEFDKHNLRTLFEQTLQRLDLPDENLPVYVTADRSLNAGALHLGLGAFFKSLNGVYLNRQTLHRLTAAEVQDTMGHELGHYYRYYLLADRFRAVTLVLAILLALFITQSSPVDPSFGILILMFVGSAFWWLSRLPYARHAQAIEYLCDDLGAQVNGVATAINSLLKFGLSAEAEFAVQQQALLAHSKQLSVADIANAVEQAIPYGYSSREELEASVQRAVRERAAKEQEVSLTGFLKHMWAADAEDEEQVEELADKLRLLNQIPRLDWESLLPDAQRVAFDEHSLPRLIQMIEQNPRTALFKSPDALASADGVHPPTSSRILYLWRNRNAIEGGAA